MTKFIRKSKAEGKITAPTSKSVAHRLLICAALCDCESRIENLPSCEDVHATIDCLRALGAQIDYDGNTARVVGLDYSTATPLGDLPCRESGSTLRFLIPIALLTGKKVNFTGSEKLFSRPQGIYEELAAEHGFLFKREKNSITLCGKLKAGEYYVKGDVSSQFITGLLFALSVLENNSRIIITSKLESSSYVELTRSAMAEFGVCSYWEDDHTLFVSGGQTYLPRLLTVEGDWSGAAFLEAFNSIGGNVKIDGLNHESCQGDQVCKELLDKLDSGFTEINLENCPDLGPILFTVAAIKNGGLFTGTKRLKIKESDRVEVMKEELSKFGAEFIIEENSITVKKKELHTPCEKLHGHNDHRVVMSLAVISSLYGGEIEGCEAVSKSYPNFFEDIKSLGIDVYEIN